MPSNSKNEAHSLPSKWVFDTKVMDCIGGKVGRAGKGILEPKSKARSLPAQGSSVYKLGLV
jgi:hypothetical protein